MTGSIMISLVNVAYIACQEVLLCEIREPKGRRKKGLLSLVIQRKQTFDYKAKALLARGNLLYTFFQWKNSTVLG